MLAKRGSQTVQSCVFTPLNVHLTEPYIRFAIESRLQIIHTAYIRKIILRSTPLKPINNIF